MSDPDPGREPLDPAIAEQLRSASTSTVAGMLQRRGIRNTFLDGLAPLTAPSRAVVGRARTLRFAPMREDMIPTFQSGFNLQRKAVEDIGPGEVLVIEARGAAGAATMGDVFAARMKFRGAVGVVSDGGVRDASAVAATGLPVYCKGTHGATFSRLHLPVGRDEPVSCAGVLVMPGDVVMADADGAVVIPWALVAEVAHDAAAQELSDTWSFERAAAGDGIQDVFPPAAHRRAEFEAWLAARRS